MNVDIIDKTLTYCKYYYELKTEKSDIHELVKIIKKDLLRCSIRTKITHETFISFVKDKIKLIIMKYKVAFTSEYKKQFNNIIYLLSIILINNNVNEPNFIASTYENIIKQLFNMCKNAHITLHQKIMINLNKINDVPLTQKMKNKFITKFSTIEFSFFVMHVELRDFNKIFKENFEKIKIHMSINNDLYKRICRTSYMILLLHNNFEIYSCEPYINDFMSFIKIYCVYIQNISLNKGVLYYSYKTHYYSPVKVINYFLMLKVDIDIITTLLDKNINYESNELHFMLSILEYAHSHYPKTYSKNYKLNKKTIIEYINAKN